MRCCEMTRKAIATKGFTIELGPKSRMEEMMKSRIGLNQCRVRQWDRSFRTIIKYPRRYGRKIIIPYDPAAEFFWLDAQRHQFFWIMTFTDLSNYYHQRRFFGGIDDGAVFLVRLWDDSDVVQASVMMGKIDQFYESICSVPRKIRKEKGYKRQGDIFAVPIVSLKEFKEVYDHAGSFHRRIHDNNKYKKIFIRAESSLKILGTRHLLKGVTVGRVTWEGVSYPFLCNGIIRAPDHPPLDLGSETLHAIYQTVGLYYPLKAD